MNLIPFLKRALPAFGLLAILVLLGMSVRPAHAGSIVVNSLDDTTGANGQCTLREAITNANSNAQSYADCAPGAGNDTITFASSIPSGTITLGSALPFLSGELTIDGPDRQIAVSGADSVQVFWVSTGAVVTLEGLVIRDGNTLGAGGGIYNVGTLTVANSVLSDNSAGTGGGIFNWGTLTVTNGTLSANVSARHGGGIFNSSGGGTLTITNSTLSGNSSGGLGGGIAISGTAAIADSILSANASASAGGGIYNDGALTIADSVLSGNSSESFGGGGIYTRIGTLTVTNSTLSANSADHGGGIMNVNSGTLTVTNSTLSANSSTYGSVGGGGIYNENGTLTITNSTLSGNSSTSTGGGIHNQGASTLAVTNTLFTNSTGGNCTGLALGSSNIADDSSCGSTVKTGGEINLGRLQDNGGPTLTHALQPGSHAIDFISSASCDVGSAANGLDQRGVTRPQGTGCDVGAYEFNQSTPPPTTYTFTGFFDPIDTLPAFNQIKAGRTVPLKFSLGGDQGLDILASGSPSSATILCDSNLPPNPINPEATSGPGNSTLSYDALSDTYTYLWKTNKQWANTCRQFTLTLDDGSVHSVNFSFTR